MDLYKRIVAGADFAELAREYSQGAGQADGGDIGWVSRGKLVSGIEAGRLRQTLCGTGEHAFPNQQVHIVKLEARESGTVLPLATVAPKIKEELQSKALEDRFVKWLKTDLRRKHRVDVKIAGVVFKPEDSKEGMVDSLMAKSTRSKSNQSDFSQLPRILSILLRKFPWKTKIRRVQWPVRALSMYFGVPLPRIL